MVKELVHDTVFLGAKSEMALAEDLQTAADLLDTLIFHKEECVGMAANMIGVRKCIIAFLDQSTKQDEYTVMLNPEIIKKDGVYEAEEGCLSLVGPARKTKRYKSVKVKWETTDFKVKIKTFTGFTAQIIQHEIDHCNGILI